MNRFLPIAAGLVLLALVFVGFRGSNADRATGAQPGAAAGKLSASAVLKIDPATPSANRPATHISPPPQSPLLQAWRERRDWAGLYKQLKSAPPTAEGQYLLAEILSACAKRPQTNAATPEQQRANFLASLPPKDPNLEKRKAAFEQLNNERCGELTKIDYNEAEVNQLLDASAAGGDPRARAWLLARDISRAMDIESANRDPSAPRKGGYPVSEAQFASMRELLGSQDPGVINEFRNILSSTLSGAAIRIGPNQEAIDNQAMYHALGLVACDFGAPCGANTPDMLNACANTARCDTGNLYDYTYYYGVSPYAAQLVERYRDWLSQMISTRNFEQLTLVPVPGTPPGVSIFGGRRR